MRLASPVGSVPAYDLIETLDSDTNPSFSNRAEECAQISVIFASKGDDRRHFTTFL